MDRCVLYFLAGNNYAARFMVSLASLRKWHPDVPVVVLSSDRPAWLMRFDGKYGVQVKQCPLAKIGRNASYATKPSLYLHTPAEWNIFIDADTQIVDDISELWPRSKEEFVVTRFADWVTTGKIVSGRIKGWQAVAPELVAQALTKTAPAVNTGIFAFHKKCPFMEPWAILTMKKPSYMCDEISCQLLYQYYPHRMPETDKYNCSARFGITRDRAAIFHFHGEGHCRDRQDATTLWWGQLQECWAANMANCRDWLRPLLIPQEREAMAKMGVTL